MRWLGVGWHLSSDTLAIMGAVLLVVNTAWLAVYTAVLLTYSRPQEGCARSGGGSAAAHHAVVWGLLGFLGLNIVMAAAMVWVGSRGTPLQPSRRWLMGPLMYCQLAKWIAFLVFSCFSIYEVYTLPPSCWQAGRRGAVEGLLWSTIGVFIALGISFRLCYNELASKDPAERWEVRLRRLSRLKCCKLLTSPPPGAEDDPGRRSVEAAPPLKEVSRFMARSFGATNLEKTDVVTGLFLATVMVRQQRRAAAAARLRAAGVRLAPGVVEDGELAAAEQVMGLAAGEAGGQQERGQQQRVLQRQQQGARRQQGGRPAHGWDGAGTLQQGSTGGAATRCAAGPAGGQSPDQRDSLMPAGADLAGAELAGAELADADLAGADLAGADVSIPVEEEDSEEEAAFWGWLRGVCEPPAFLVEPPGRAAELAPQLSPRQIAAICCEGTLQPVPRQVLEEAQVWVWHAVAAYGTQGLAEHSKRPWLTRLRLLGAGCPRGRVARHAPLPVKSKLVESRKYVRHYISGKKVAGFDDVDVIYLSFAESVMGAVPYGIVLDRPRRTVVVTIRGTASMASLLSDLSDRPEELSSWLPPAFKQAHHLREEEEVQGHSGILSAATGVLEDLERHQIVRILLTGVPRDSAAAGAGLPRVAPGADGALAGAGIAALLAPHFADWWPDVHAWAFCPPGGMVTPNLAAALEPAVTCIVVGKDSVSRTATASFERLQDQVVVALARCRLSKLRVLLRGRSRAFQQLPPATLFHPPHSIPHEALRYVQSYFDTKKEHRQVLVHMEPPGRCALLRRLKGAPQGGKKQAAQGSCKQRAGCCCEAVWVDRLLLLREGILLSCRQVTDHYTSKLTAALRAALRGSSLDGGLTPKGGPA